MRVWLLKQESTIIYKDSLPSPLPESIMKTCSGVLTFESADKILWCDHSNETSLAVLLHGTICFTTFYKCGIFRGKGVHQHVSPTFALSVGSTGQSASSRTVAASTQPLAAAQSSGVHRLAFLCIKIY